MAFVESSTSSSSSSVSPTGTVPPSITTHKGSTTFCSIFRKEATATEALQELCFSSSSSLPMEHETAIVHVEGPPICPPPLPVSVVSKTTSTVGTTNTTTTSTTTTNTTVDPVPISAASSICSAHTHSSNQNYHHHHHHNQNNNINNSNLHYSGNLSDAGSTHSTQNSMLLKRTVSRHGRATQRYATDPTSQSTIRLTTGCIPIVKGGKVMFVSASNKPSWIFPKGGWELDETIEESAIREAFEEAGVIGVLGPKLSDVQYETRKAKKRRLETEEFLRKNKKEKKNEVEENGGEKTTTDSVSVDEHHSTPPSTTSPIVAAASMTATSATVSDEALARIRNETSIKKPMKQSDETASVHSDASGSAGFARMALFPLYVTSVESTWPESGRLRKAVDIDKAIQMLESRPELQTALKEVKEKELHLKMESQ